MKRTGVDVELGRHAGSDQATRIVDILIDEEVERTGHDERRRQSGEIGRAGGCGVGGDGVAAWLLTE
jgi:hypothetical protein